MSTNLTTDDLDAAGRSSRRRPLLLALGLAGIALLLLGACGSEDGSSSDDTTTTTEEQTTTTEEEEDEDEVFDPSQFQPQDGGAVAMNSETIRDCLGVNDLLDYDISVPGNTSATLTVTPIDDIDIVVIAADGTIVDDGLRGEAELLTGDGPIEDTITVHEFFGDPGCFELTLES